MGLRAPESKNGDHFFTRTPPQNGGLGICFMCLPRKVIFGHFIDFEYFGSDFSCFYIVKEIKTSNGHTKAIYGSIMLKFFLWAPITQWHHICRRQNVTQKSRFAEHPTAHPKLTKIENQSRQKKIWIYNANGVKMGSFGFNCAGGILIATCVLIESQLCSEAISW